MMDATLQNLSDPTNRNPYKNVTVKFAVAALQLANKDFLCTSIA